MKERMRMDNKIKLRITRYQRLAMEHAKTLEELEQTKADIKGAIRACSELRIMINDMSKELEATKRHNEVLKEMLQWCGVQGVTEDDEP